MTDEQNTIQNKKALWETPWGYKESFLLITALYLGAVLLEVSTGIKAPLISFPINIILLLLIASLSVFIHLFSKKSYLFQWLSSIPASIGAIVFFVFVSLVMALIPQNTDTESLFFIYNVLSSWTYYIATFYLLIILGIVVLKRIYPFTHRNFGFALSHLGLWITIAAAGFGAGDVQKMSMLLYENEQVWYAYDKNSNQVELDFAIHLVDFEMDEFPAKIAFVDAKSGEFLEEKGRKAIFDLDTVNPIVFKSYKVSVDKFYKNSMFYEGNYFPITDMGSTQSALISVTGKYNFKKQGWLGAKSVTQNPSYLFVDDYTAIAMLQPEAKRFTSHIIAYNKQGEKVDTVLEVNKAFVYNGWKIYQTGYDEEKGKWSDLSIVEIVRDRWLPFVYVGIFMLLAGAFYLIWFGRGIQKK